MCVHNYQYSHKENIKHQIGSSGEFEVAKKVIICTKCADVKYK